MQRWGIVYMYMFQGCSLLWYFCYYKVTPSINYIILSLYRLGLVLFSRLQHYLSIILIRQTETWQLGCIRNSLWHYLWVIFGVEKVFFSPGAKVIRLNVCSRIFWHQKRSICGVRPVVTHTMSDQLVNEIIDYCDHIILSLSLLWSTSEQSFYWLFVS